MSADIEVLYDHDADVDRCLAVLAVAYATDRFTRDWWEWKHQSGPWGPSRPVLVTSESGDLGAFFALPWHYRAGGVRIPGVRVVDGGTTPAARRRGVLQAMIRREVITWGDENPGIVVATATPQAQGSHLKNGATVLPPLRYHLGLVSRVGAFLRPARLREGLDVLDDYQSDDSAGIGSDWSPAALRWRTDPRSGNTYAVAALAEATAPNGLVYRIANLARLRVLIPLATWGSRREIAVLLGSALRRSRGVAVYSPAGPGAVDLPVRWVKGRSEVLVCVWERGRLPADCDPTVLSGWRLGCAEVEGLI